MQLSVDELLEQVQHLSTDDRELLLERLRQAFAPPLDPDVEASWLAEAERRMDAIDRGELASIPWDVAKRQLGL
ncbi:MAG TPA: addiction module protein [Burkholderiaceae bacterium]|nr:addiction module protein [Burkholderiaceae bacterium]